MAYLTPDEIPEETDCRSLLIPANSDWLALVSGAINELAKSYNWEQFGTVTPDQAADRALQMWQEFVESDCSSGVCTRYRTNPVTLVLEVSYDDGATWETDTAIPVSPDRPTGESDPLCLAARNVAEVLAILYEDTIDSYNVNTAFDLVLGNFASTLGLIISSLFGAPVAAIIAAGSTVFSLAYQTLDVLLTDYWTTEITERLTCIVLQNATQSGLRVLIDGEQLMYDLRTEFFSGLGDFSIPQALVWEQIVYLISILGQDGLNHAAATTAIEEYTCGCDEWCHEFFFSEDDGGWVCASNAFIVCGASYEQTNGWSYADQQNGTTAWSRMAYIDLTFPQNADIRHIDFDWTLSKGSFQSNVSIWSIEIEGVNKKSELASVVSSGVQTDFWSGGQVGDNIRIFTRSSQQNTAIFSGSTVINRVRITGVGEDPLSGYECT